MTRPKLQASTLGIYSQEPLHASILHYILTHNTHTHTHIYIYIYIYIYTVYIYICLNIPYTRIF